MCVLVELCIADPVLIINTSALSNQVLHCFDLSRRIMFQKCQPFKVLSSTLLSAAKAAIKLARIQVPFYQVRVYVMSRLFLIY